MEDQEEEENLVEYENMETVEVEFACKKFTIKRPSYGRLIIIMSSRYIMKCKNPFNIVNPKTREIIKVPCGKCLYCRIRKRSEWALRLEHELQYWDKSVFVTLTYDDAHLPQNRSLKKEDLQKFFKRVRKAIYPKKIKYYACGEYGELNERPHYHAIMFGIGMDHCDRNHIISCWPLCSWNRSIVKNAFGIVEKDSIRYVCQYVDKKLSGSLLETVYTKRGMENIFKIQSQGLGLRYAQDFEKKIRMSELTYRGMKCSIPRYYLKKLAVDETELKAKAIETTSLEVSRLIDIEIDPEILYAYHSDLYTEYEKEMYKQNTQRIKNLQSKQKLKLRELTDQDGTPF